MELRQTLGITDYIVLGLCLLVSLVIGIKVRRSSKKQTVQDYLVAGRDMAMLPVVLSICVTVFSGLNFLSGPMEVYRYGIQHFIGIIPYVIGTCAASLVFIPVYFECGVSSIYEFLEIRYGRLTRRINSGIFLLYMVLFMGVVLYAPSLALSVVTDLSLEASIIIVGLCCSIYSSIGGLKGVLWTDTFQSILIFLFLIIIFARGTRDAGGFKEIFRKADEGGRLSAINYQFDLTTRYNVWNVIMRPFLTGMAYYGSSQIEIQRVLSLKTRDRALSATFRSLVLTSVMLTTICTLGLVLYAIFFECDPVMNKADTGLSKYDQVLPYYIVSRFSQIPGLTGLCIAGIVSGSLSTISSALNSASTVTVIDLIKPIFGSENLTESKSVFLAKALTMMYGVISIGVAFVIANAESIQAVVMSLGSIVEGPVLAIFLIGVLTRKGTQKCILPALFLGIALTTWASYGYIIGGKSDPSLPVNIDGCSSTRGNLTHNPIPLCGGHGQCTSNATLLHKDVAKSDLFVLYRLSYNWFSLMGLLTTSITAFVGIVITGWNNNVIPEDSKCLSPVTQVWRRPKKAFKKLTNENVAPEENVALCIIPESKIARTTSRNYEL